MLKTEQLVFSLVGVANLKFGWVGAGGGGDVDGDEAGAAAAREVAFSATAAAAARSLSSAFLAWNFAALRLSRSVFRADFFLGAH